MTDQTTLDFRIDSNVEGGFAFSEFQDSMRQYEYNSVPEYIRIRKLCISELSAHISRITYDLYFNFLTGGYVIKNGNKKELFEFNDRGTSTTLIPKYSGAKASEIALRLSGEAAQSANEVIAICCPLPKKRRYETYSD
jgi:hypothetical protein